MLDLRCSACFTLLITLLRFDLLNLLENLLALSWLALARLVLGLLGWFALVGLVACFAFVWFTVLYLLSLRFFLGLLCFAMTCDS